MSKKKRGGKKERLQLGSQEKVKGEDPMKPLTTEGKKKEKKGGERFC